MTPSLPSLSTDGVISEPNVHRKQQYPQISGLNCEVLTYRGRNVVIIMNQFPCKSIGEILDCNKVVFILRWSYCEVLLYICTVCMYSMHVQYACTVCMYSICVQYVCTVRMYSMQNIHTFPPSVRGPSITMQDGWQHQTILQKSSTVASIGPSAKMNWFALW